MRSSLPTSTWLSWNGAARPIDTHRAHRLPLLPPSAASVAKAMASSASCARDELRGAARTARAPVMRSSCNRSGSPGRRGAEPLAKLEQLEQTEPVAHPVAPRRVEVATLLQGP